MSAWTALLEGTRTVFSAPGFALFADLLTGWVCAPGRRTITAMITVADPAGRRAHDAYHRFVRDGAWAMSGLWRVLAVHAVTRFAPAGVLALDCDDTLFHRAGPKVNGAGVFRDAVRSTAARVVYALGLNLLVLTLRVTPPWGGCPIALPVNIRLHRKKDTTTTVAHAAAMVRELAGWLPERQLHLCADGAYASLAGADLPRTHLTSRMRRDGALYEAAPARTGKRGRPPTKGDRLPIPTALAAQANNRRWRKVTVDVRGTSMQRLVCVRDVLWYAVNSSDLLRLVIVRDPGPDRTRRLLRHHRPHRHRRPGRLPLRRPLVHRGVLPRHQTAPRRPRPTVMEAPGPRTRRRPVPVAARTHLVLVPPGPPNRPHLDPPTLVPGQGHPQLPRRARRPTQNPVVPTNYSNLRSPRRHPQNHRCPTRHARLRRLNLRKSTGRRQRYSSRPSCSSMELPERWQ